MNFNWINLPKAISLQVIGFMLYLFTKFIMRVTIIVKTINEFSLQEWLEDLYIDTYELGLEIKMELKKMGEGNNGKKDI